MIRNNKLWILIIGMIIMSMSAMATTVITDTDITTVNNMESGVGNHTTLFQNSIPVLDASGFNAENLTGGTIAFARLPTLTDTHTHNTDNLTNVAGLNNAITLQGDNITGGTIPFARLPTLTDTHTHSAENITSGDFNDGNYSFDNDTLFINADTSKVGIKNNNPSAYLTIGTNADIPAIGLNVIGFTDTDSDANIEIGDGAGTVYWRLRRHSDNSFKTVLSNPWNIYGSNVSIDTNTLFIDVDNDKIGIGTTTPSTELEVNGNITGDYLFGTFAGDFSLENISAKRYNGVYHVNEYATSGTGTEADPYRGFDNSIQEIANMSDVAIIFDSGHYSFSVAQPTHNFTATDYYTFGLVLYNNTYVGGIGDVHITQDDNLQLYSIFGTYNVGTAPHYPVYDLTVENINCNGNLNGSNSSPKYVPATSNGSMCYALTGVNRMILKDLKATNIGLYGGFLLKSYNSYYDNLECYDTDYLCIFFTGAIPRSSNNIFNSIIVRNTSQSAMFLEDDTEYTTINSVNCENVAGNCVDVTGSFYTTIGDINAKDSGRALVVQQDAHDLDVSNIYIKNSTYESILFQGYGENIDASFGNIIINNNNPSQAAIAFTNTTGNILFSNILIKDSNEGIKFNTANQAENITISNIVFDNVTTKITGTYKSLYMRELNEVTGGLNVDGSKNSSFNNSDLFINPSLGKVGIGTTTPGGKLDIGTNVAFSGGLLRILGYGSSDSDANIEIGDGAGTVYWRLRRHSDNTFRTVMSSDWGITGGNVGIGTTSPSQKLNVVGNINVTGDLIVDSNTLYVNSSDNTISVNFAGIPNDTLHVNGGAYFEENVSVFDLTVRANASIHFGEPGFVDLEATSFEINNKSRSGVRATGDIGSQKSDNSTVFNIAQTTGNYELSSAAIFATYNTSDVGLFKTAPNHISYNTTGFLYNEDGELRIAQENDGYFRMGFYDTLNSSDDFSIIRFEGLTDVFTIANSSDNYLTTFNYDVDMSNHLDVSGNITGNFIIGEVYIYNNSDETLIASADVWYNITNGTTEGITNGMNYSYPDLIIDRAGLYELSYTLSYSDSGNTYAFTIGENGIAHEEKCEQEGEISNQGETMNIKGQCLQQLNVGDHIHLMTLNRDTTENPTIYDSNLIVKMVGT